LTVDAASPTRVLVVDDEPALLLSYSAILQKSGYIVTVAQSAAAARSALASACFDIMLCDLGLEMPMAGLEVVEWACREFPAMRSILMTGFLDDPVADRASAVGALALSKPIQVRALLELLHDLSARR